MIDILEPEITRLRATFSKFGDIRFVGALDLQRVWERTLRRAGLPVAYSQGFHPQPRLQLASALPLGIASRCEIIDIWLRKPVDLNAIIDQLNRVAPPGLSITMVVAIPLKDPPTQTTMTAADFIIETPILPVDFDPHSAVQRLLQAASLPRTRREKQYDLRPLILALEVLPAHPGGIIHLLMRLSAREGATGRPDEVLDELGINPHLTRIERTGLIFQA